MKTCTKCGEGKPSSAFRTNRRSCKKCENAYCRQHHANNKDHANARNKRWKINNAEHVKTYKDARYAERRDFIDAAKSKPCIDCGGVFPPCVMDFDHVRGTKKFQIAWSLNSNLDKIQAEMNKCELVCANCHRIRTHITRKQ